MSGRRNAGIALIVAFVVLVAVLALVGGSDDSPAEGSLGANPPAEDGELQIVVAGQGCELVQVASAAMRNRGFTAEQFVIGEDQVNWDAPEANERGEGAFVQETPRTADAVVDQLSDDTDQARAALEHLVSESGSTEEQLLDPVNWIPVQMNVDSVLDGNTAYRNGEAVDAGSRESAAGEVVWLFVRPEVCEDVDMDGPDVEPPNGEDDGNIAPEDAVTAHRAGCGNPQSDLPRPPAPPAPPDTTVPPTVPPSTTPPTTEGPKCRTENGVLVPGSDPDGDGYCGTPNSGPEQQPPYQPPPPEYPTPPEPPAPPPTQPRPPGPPPPPPPEVPPITVPPAPQPPPPPPGGN